MLKLGNPQKFFGIFLNPAKYCLILSLLIAAIAGYGGLFIAPPDYQQSDSARIMYVHVPAAWMSMMCYTIIAINSIIFLVWRSPLAHLVAKSTAIVGITHTAITLITGMIWGKPMWGAWWAWDARLTSMLILFFIYASYMLLSNIYNNVNVNNNHNRAIAFFAIFGWVNIPIIKFSVDWWHSLHQPASIMRFDGTVTIHSDMLWPLLLMALAFLLFSLSIIIIRTHTNWLEMRYQVDLLKKLG